MELAKLTSKGQITVPAEIRRRLKLKKGDKVFFVEDKGRIYFENSSQFALKKIQDEMEGEAEKTDFRSEEDVIGYIKNFRKKIGIDATVKRHFSAPTFCRHIFTYPAQAIGCKNTQHKFRYVLV